MKLGNMLDCDTMEAMETVRLSDQVAGHPGIYKAKGVIIKPCTQEELNFYASVTAAKHAIMEYIPKFMGTLKSTQLPDQQSKHEVAMVLKDIEHGFKKPCVMDIKLGKVLASPVATAEKKARLEKVSNETTSGSVGLRIAGMKVWETEKNEPTMYGKEYGRSLTSSNIQEAFKTFFTPLMATHPREMLSRYDSTINDIISAIEYAGLKLYSSSLLIVYESDRKSPRKTMDIKLIDFAHATLEHDDIDFNTMQGLDNAARIIRGIAKAQF